MNKNTKTILLFAAFALFIALAAFAYNRLGQNATPRSDISVTPEEGEVSQAKKEEKKKAPDFTVLDADGNSVKLSDF